MTDGFKDCDYVGIINELCPNLKNSEPGHLNERSLPYLKSIIHIGENRQPGMYAWSDLFTFARKISDLELNAVKNELNSHDIVNMQYTSGTTGFPKGVMLSHYNVVNNGKCIGDCMKFTEMDRLCIPVPFFYCFGLVLAILACVTHASTMVPVEYYQPLKVMQAIQKERCTAVHGVPTMFIGILEHPEFKNYKFEHLRTGIMAGSPCPIKIMKQVVDEMGIRDITIAYGLTEASPVCTQTTTNDSIEVKVSTIGRSMPHIEIKIIDPESGETVLPGINGELCARGYNIMKGYYKMPEATAQVIDKDGWLHTGDLATVDENGYYKITGRLKDMIIRGGENIYPKEIEEFIYTHPAVCDVQVIGVPSKDYGEEVMACIVLKEGLNVTEEEIKDFVKSNMARHKTPKYVWFMDSFPTTASGKIKKYKLREMAIERFNLKEAAAIETA